LLSKILLTESKRQVRRMPGLRSLNSASLRFSKKEVVCIVEHVNAFSKTKTIFDIKERRA